MLKKGGIILFCVFLLGACATSKNKTRVTTPVTPPKPLYVGTEFPDIVIPSSMKIIREKSLLVRTSNYIGGVLTIKGPVKVESLVTFFKTQLASRGWQLNGAIRYQNTLLTFDRPNGTCFVYISEPGLGTTTEVQIWASETLQEGE